MNKLKRYMALALVVTLIASESILAGGGNRNGTAGAAQLLIPVGTRGIAMGSSTLTNSMGAEGIFWNPANLSRSDVNTDVYFSHMEYIADIGVEYGAISTSLEGFGSVGLAIKSLSVGEIPITTVDNPDGTGAKFTPQFLIVGATYSKLLSDRVSVGLTANLVSETLDRVTSTGVSFDVGITYTNLGTEGLDLAIVMKNLGPQMQYDGSGLLIEAEANDSRGAQYYKIESASYELPTSLEIGLGYSYNINQENMLLVTGAFQNNQFWGDQYLFGGEYSFKDMLFLRAGYSAAPDMNKNQNNVGLTAGAGVAYSVPGFNIKFDYAYRDVDLFDANHVFSIGLGF
jgi:hypothetical protein